MNAAKSTVLVFALGLLLVLSVAPADAQKIDKTDDTARTIQRTDLAWINIDVAVDGWGFPIGFAFAGGGCPGDIDGCGNVDITDLLILLGSWGPCPDPCPPFCPILTECITVNTQCSHTGEYRVEIGRH